MNDIPYLDAFMDMMIAERSVSKNTLTAYETDIKQAHIYCTKHQHDLSLASSDVMMRMMRAWARLAPRTRTRKLSSLRQYYRFLISEKVRKDDPTTVLDGPKLPRDLPDVLSIEDMDALIQAAASTQQAKGLRMVALLELCYGSGLRVSELVSLPLSAFSSRQRALIVRGKGDKERMVPLSQPAIKAVDDYLKVRSEFLKSDDDKNNKIKKIHSPYLFPSWGREGYLSRIRFYQLLKDLAVLAGVPIKKVHPHSLRHAFATHVLSGGADLRSLQQMLGHADIGSTQIYTHVVRGHLQKTVDTHHPLAKRYGAKKHKK